MFFKALAYDHYLRKKIWNILDQIFRQSWRGRIRLKLLDILGLDGGRIRGCGGIFEDGFEGWRLGQEVSVGNPEQGGVHLGRGYTGRFVHVLFDDLKLFQKHDRLRPNLRRVFWFCFN